MKFVVAPDKFKGCLSANRIAQFITDGVLAALPHAQVDQCPMADGGEGTVDAILQATGGRLLTRRVTGPLPEMKVDASFAMLADGTTAVIEMSAASGLGLLELQDRNPLNTTTFGTGELMVAAIKEGAKKIILGLGGSATIDAGIGCAQACGFTVLLRDGQPTAMTEPLCGRDLADVLMVKHGRGEATSGIEIIAATDVTNPLFGDVGAPHFFGQQKGATPSIIAQLDSDLQNLSHRTGTNTQARQFGAGAAGGLGFGVVTFMNGTLVNGLDLVGNMVGLKHRLTNADLCITGEGRLDSQTAGGKTVAGVAKICRDRNIPCIALVGASELQLDHPKDQGLIAHFAICDRPMSLEESLHRAGELLTHATYNAVKLWSTIKKEATTD